jgi:sugar/nucleoside kinase (ribokinase family)
VKAAKDVLALGPKSLVVKHGEYGATAFFGPNSFTEPGHAHHPFRAPALPLAEVVDPTGAGDSFAGGFFGYIASQPELTPQSSSGPCSTAA